MELIRGVQETFEKEGRIKIVTQVQVCHLNYSPSHPLFLAYRRTGRALRNLW